ncbi:MAG: tyrosine--tRNA ligase [Anaerolineae bacterium]|nr:tyrosine--tRNA ligase [Anaerolineae bacterium]
MAFDNAFDDLKWRGLVFDFTEGLPEILAKEKVTVYIGFDPSSNSLQVGNLLALMGLARLQRYGHTPLALAGGGTGMIGDPSGKKSERQMLSVEQVEANVEAIKRQLARFLDFEVKDNTAQIINNADWLRSVTMMEFLRDVGKHFTVNYMMAKDSVKTRLDRESGISYAEFSYQLLQAYDFLQLHDRYNCTLQSGGSDQWGNILSGVELIRRKRSGGAHGMVYPLVTDADGNKLGKTERGTIWLDAERTSPYRYYQFWLNQADAETVDYLKYFTWLQRDEIEDLAQKTSEHPERREAQRVLAEAMTRITHGETALDKALRASRVLFGGDMAGLDAADIQDIFADVPSSDVARSRLEGAGVGIVDLLDELQVTRSRGEARRLVKNGGVYVNNVKVEDAAGSVALSDAVDGKFVVLRRGKKSYHLVRLIG